MRSRRQTFLMRLQHNLQIFSPRNLLVATICTFCLTCSLCVWGVLTRLALWINRFCIPTFSAIFVRDVAPCAKNAHRLHLPVRFPVFSECHPRDKNIRLEPESIVFLLRPATNANACAILFFFFLFDQTGLPEKISFDLVQPWKRGTTCSQHCAAARVGWPASQCWEARGKIVACPRERAFKLIATACLQPANRGESPSWEECELLGNHLGRPEQATSFTQWRNFLAVVSVLAG